MKLIHCADLHLDSKMEANLNKEQAKERRGELLATFERLVDYAAGNGVEAVLIAGDMFDKPHIRKEAKRRVMAAISENPGVEFYYIKGNHDKCDFIEEGIDEVPDNLHLFDRDWISYEQGEVVITGVELLSSNSATVADRLVLDRAKTNIVMLHGQEVERDGKRDAELVNISGLKDKGVDYLALGHIHSYSLKQLDDRGVYCYCGCLEGRGFDETGDKGFVLLEVNGGKIESEFIPFADRRLHEIPVRVTVDMEMSDILSESRRAIAEADVDSKDMLKLVLTGERELDFEPDVNRIVRTFASDYYFVKCYDRTKMFIDYESFKFDRSLKGEFVRLVQEREDLSEEEKSAIIELGIKAIMGEDIE